MQAEYLSCTTNRTSGNCERVSEVRVASGKDGDWEGGWREGQTEGWRED